MHERVPLRSATGKFRSFGADGEGTEPFDEDEDPSGGTTETGPGVSTGGPRGPSRSGVEIEEVDSRGWSSRRGGFAFGGGAGGSGGDGNVGDKGGGEEAGGAVEEDKGEVK